MKKPYPFAAVLSRVRREQGFNNAHSFYKARDGRRTLGWKATGSGAVALAIKHERKNCRVVAVEADLAALLTAKRNAAKFSLEVDFRHGRWFEPVARERFDLVVANPPYVAEGDPHLADLRYEPRGALVSGADGLDAIREIVPAVGAFLRPGGWLLLEHGMGQDAAVRSLIGATGLVSVTTWPDLAGIARVTGGKLES